MQENRNHEDREPLHIPRKHRQRDIGWIYWMAGGVLVFLILMKLIAAHS